MKKILSKIESLEPHYRYLFYVFLGLMCMVYVFWKSDVVGRVDDPLMEVKNVATVKAFAVADATYLNGFTWVLDVTIPMRETVVKIKFANWAGSNQPDSVANNIRFYSSQFSNAIDADHAMVASAADTFSDELYINPKADLDSEQDARQIQIVVEAMAPLNTVGGSYSLLYNLETDPDTVPPQLTILGDNPVTVQLGTEYVDAGATAQDLVFGDVASAIKVTGLPIDTSVIGDHVVTYAVADPIGNQSESVTRTVHVINANAPTIESHDTVTADPTSADGGTVTYENPLATDTVDGPILTTCLPSSGSLFAVGNTQVTCTATDSDANVTQSTFTVHVNDYQAPAPQTHSVNYSAGENGSISGSASQTVVDGDSATSVTAVANDGFVFSGWSDGAQTNPRTDEHVTGDISVAANFAPAQ